MENRSLELRDFQNFIRFPGEEGENCTIENPKNNRKKFNSYDYGSNIERIVKWNCEGESEFFPAYETSNPRNCVNSNSKRANFVIFVWGKKNLSESVIKGGGDFTETRSS